MAKSQPLTIKVEVSTDTLRLAVLHERLIQLRRMRDYHFTRAAAHREQADAYARDVSGVEDVICSIGQDTPHE
jgi:hypothetical protein